MCAVQVCPNCGSRNVVRDFEHGEVYCNDCGMIIDENIVDTGPEWRAYTPDEALRKARTGPPATYRAYNKGLGTGTGPRTPKSRTDFRTKRLEAAITTTGHEKILAYALGEIERMSAALGLPGDTREETSLLFRKIMGKGLLRGRSIEEIVSGLLFIVCKKQEIPRTMNEIAKVSRSTLKKIRRTYFFLARHLDLKLKPSDPSLYIPRFCSKLGLSARVRECAMLILKKDNGRMQSRGRSPIGIAGAAIYTASKICSEWRTAEQIARATDTTAITIRTRSRELEQNIGIKDDMFQTFSSR